MANQIINNLLIDGSIVKGDFFKKLQNEFSDVFARRKVAKKAITDRTQEKYINGVHDVKTCDCLDCCDERESSNFIWAN
jgi:hypothetical protein